MSQADTPLSYALRNDIAFVTMDDGKANALSYVMLDALSAAITRAEGEAKVLVLGGRPGRFSAGFDLKVMMSGPQEAGKLLQRGGEVLLQLFGSKLPTIAACTGHALAGGALMLMSCDTRIGASGAFKLGLNEVQIGIPVPLLGYRLARDRLSSKAFYAATVQATIYDPAGAVEAGFLDQCVAPEALLESVTTEATRLASLSGSAYAFTKDCIRGPLIAAIREDGPANLVAIRSLMGG
ncbi:MAG: crotonase/enoyl-CoA hydratase family protein [Nannocystaceae bacterium]